jgi:hypothetical protein
MATDNYRRQAKAISLKERSAMRNRIRAERVQFAASMAGQRVVREFVDEDGVARLIYRGPGDNYFVCEDPEQFSPELCNALRAELVGFFEQKCPACEAPMRTLDEDEVRMVDQRVVTVRTTGSVLDAGDEDHPPTLAVDTFLAIEHTADCFARPAAIELTRLDEP